MGRLVAIPLLIEEPAHESLNAHSLGHWQALGHPGQGVENVIDRPPFQCGNRLGNEGVGQLGFMSRSPRKAVAQKP